MRVTDEEIAAALASTSPELVDALSKLAAERIERHHARQLPKDDIYEDAIGVGLGSRWTAIDAVGLYVPGGTASYPSSVLMNALPAKVAGVPRVGHGHAGHGWCDQSDMLSGKHAGVTEIYRIGGALRCGGPCPWDRDDCSSC